MSEKLTSWANNLTTLQRRELGIVTGATGTYLAHILTKAPQTVRVSTAYATMEYAKKLGKSLTIEDFCQVVSRVEENEDDDGYW
jgi:hypothetical protein